MISAAASPRQEEQVLVDVQLRSDVRRELVALGCDPVRISRGLYVNCGFNFAHAVHCDDLDSLYLFGVADSAEQFLAKFGKQLEESASRYVVGFTEALRSEEPSRGGWRWRKWGPYIGDRTPRCEYLRDEPEIDRVIVFDVYKVSVGDVRS
jgi:hypothetical protein